MGSAPTITVMTTPDFCERQRFQSARFHLRIPSSVFSLWHRPVTGCLLERTRLFVGPLRVFLRDFVAHLSYARCRVGVTFRIEQRELCQLVASWQAKKP
jgi:hypothetical protein